MFLHDAMGLQLMVFKATNMFAPSIGGVRKSAKNIKGCCWFPTVDAGKGGRAGTLMNRTSEGQQGGRQHFFPISGVLLTQGA